jgi:hypothetical protein
MSVARDIHRSLCKTFPQEERQGIRLLPAAATGAPEAKRIVRRPLTQEGGKHDLKEAVPELPLPEKAADSHPHPVGQSRRLRPIAPQLFR